MIYTKQLILIVAALTLGGCSMLERQDSAQKPAGTVRKLELKKCIHDFLAEDVPPSSSLQICETIYKRWES